jgi:hypothetical protein
MIFLTDCEVTEWGPWSACTVTCGKGVKYKQRSYVDNMKAQIKSCNVKLTAKYRCQGAYETCRFVCCYVPSVCVLFYFTHCTDTENIFKNVPEFLNFIRNFSQSFKFFHISSLKLV